MKNIEIGFGAVAAHTSINLEERGSQLSRVTI